MYNPTKGSYAVVGYTSEMRMKYPDPHASVRVFTLDVYARGRGELDPVDATLELQWAGRIAANEKVVQGVA
jgi:hypothetical protein